MDNPLIHYYVTYSNDPQGDPLDRALQSSGVRYKLFGRKLSLRYRWRWQLVLLGLPRLLLMAAGFAWNSLFRERERPNIVMVGSHFEACVFALVRGVCFFRYDIVYLGFIYTERSGRFLTLLRRAYFSLLFRLVDVVVCYSSFEKVRYGELFPKSAHKFAFVPFGLHVPGSIEADASSSVDGRFFSAGRSGRDYVLLTKVFSNLKYELRIACDLVAVQAGCSKSSNILWLTDCFGDAYLDEIRRASVVVVPLAVEDISAGQMVVLQAMAFGKPVIVTRTPTMLDYAGVDSGVVLISPGSEKELQNAIDLVAGDAVLRNVMGAKSRESYLQRHTPKMFVRNLMDAVLSRYCVGGTSVNN